MFLDNFKIGFKIWIPVISLGCLHAGLGDL
jgi:hypothetical protein